MLSPCICLFLFYDKIDVDIHITKDGRCELLEEVIVMSINGLFSKHRYLTRNGIGNARAFRVVHGYVRNNTCGSCPYILAH